MFRLTPLGALGLQEKYAPRTPADCTALKVFSGLRLYTDKPMSSAECLALEIWANDEADGIWWLDLAKSLVVAEGGHDPDVLREFLAARDDRPLPEKVEGFLRGVERGGNALKDQGRALLVECASA